MQAIIFYLISAYDFHMHVYCIAYMRAYIFLIF